MPRRQAQAVSPPPGEARILKDSDPEAWPLLVAFDLELASLVEDRRLKLM
jgi:hypothetical protein